MFGLCIAEISQKREIRIEEPWRFPAKTATQIAPWFLASLDSITSVDLLDGVQNMQLAPKFLHLFFSREYIGFVTPVSHHVVLSILCISIQNEGGLFPLYVSTRGSILNQFSESSFSPVPL